MLHSSSPQCQYQKILYMFSRGREGTSFVQNTTILTICMSILRKETHIMGKTLSRCIPATINTKLSSWTQIDPCVCVYAPFLLENAPQCHHFKSILFFKNCFVFALSFVDNIAEGLGVNSKQQSLIRIVKLFWIQSKIIKQRREEVGIMVQWVAMETARRFLDAVCTSLWFLGMGEWNFDGITIPLHMLDAHLHRIKLRQAKPMHIFANTHANIPSLPSSHG